MITFQRIVQIAVFNVLLVKLIFGLAHLVLTTELALQTEPADVQTEEILLFQAGAALAV